MATAAEKDQRPRWASKLVRGSPIVAVFTLVMVGVGVAVLAFDIGGGGPRISASRSPRSDGATPVVDAIPTPEGVRGKCLRLTIDGVVHDGCISAPGIYAWRVADTDYLVARLALDLSDDQTLEADSSGFVVVLFDEYRDRLRLSCLNRKIFDAIALQFGDDPPPFLVTGCSPSYTFVSPEPIANQPPRVQILELRGSEWVLVAMPDFEEVDPTRRCAEVPAYPAPAGGPTALEFCSILG